MEMKENYQLTINYCGTLALAANVDYCESGRKTAKRLSFSKSNISWVKISSEDIIFCVQFFPAAKV